MQLLGQKWGVYIEGEQHPWWGFRPKIYGLRDREELARLLDHLVGLVERVGKLQAVFAERVGVAGPVEAVLHAADLLDGQTVAPPAWLTAPNFARISEDLEHLARDFESPRDSRVALLNSYGQQIFAASDGTAEQIAKVWADLAPLVGLGSGAELFASRLALLRWAQETDSRWQEWRDDTRILARWLLDLHALDPSLEVVSVLVRLFEICRPPTPPEPDWLLDPERMASCRALLAHLRSDQEQYKARRDALLRRYDERFFDLDLDHLAERFGGTYRNAWRFLLPRYHWDVRGLARLSRTGEVSANVRQDVLEARNLLCLRRQLEGASQKAGNPLGRYFQGMETDGDAVERALEHADEATRLQRLHFRCSDC